LEGQTEGNRRPSDGADNSRAGPSQERLDRAVGTDLVEMERTSDHKGERRRKGDKGGEKGGVTLEASASVGPASRICPAQDLERVAQTSRVRSSPD
jgi:hypothetical protein